jgi:hypothetical protein
VCAEPKVFVGGLRYEVTREDVEAAFRPFGNLKQVVLLKHRDSGKSKGCAMVLFESWTSAEAAIQQMNGSSDLSAPRPLVVKFADPQPRDDGVLVGVTPKKLFVGQVLCRVGCLGRSAWHGGCSCKVARACCGVPGVPAASGRAWLCSDVMLECLCWGARAQRLSCTAQQLTCQQQPSQQEQAAAHPHADFMTCNQSSSGMYHPHMPRPPACRHAGTVRDTSSPSLPPAAYHPPTPSSPAGAHECHP